jgi:hypothetical protein
VSTTTTGISQIQLVMIPSTDQDRSVALYQARGFEKRADVPWGDGHRWVELYPPKGETGIAGAAGVGRPDWRADRHHPQHRRHRRDHARLRAGGVDVDPAVGRVGAPAEIRLGAVEMAGPVPPMFYFRDPTATRC